VIPKTKTLDWGPTYRLIPSRFPTIGLFDRVADAGDLEAVFAVQGLTNPRLRQEVGDISLVASDERIAGPGSTPVMAAFCHLNSEGSRFSDGTWGVYYAASDLSVAVAEVSYHRAKFLAATSQPALEIDMRTYVAQVSKPLHDMRPKTWAHMHDPDNYKVPQSMAGQLRAQKSWGIVYNSVRELSGQCVAIFRPKGIDLPVIQDSHVALCWDGKAIAEWYKKSAIAQLPRPTNFNF
jgi:hypothetical protein